MISISRSTCNNNKHINLQLNPGLLVSRIGKTATILKEYHKTRGHTTQDLNSVSLAQMKARSVADF